jgi:hypothetical protein
MFFVGDFNILCCAMRDRQDTSPKKIYYLFQAYGQPSPLPPMKTLWCGECEFDIQDFLHFCL